MVRETSVKIRMATRADRDDVCGIHLSAFTEGERDMVSRLAVDLLCMETTPVTLSLVAESDGAAVGHVAFSPVTVGNSEHGRGYLLAPLAVKAPHQQRGVGSALVNDGMRRLSETGTALLFVYGDPGYYGRFGFSREAAEPFPPPYDLQYPFGWQAVTLDGARTKARAGPVACVPALCRPELW